MTSADNAPISELMNKLPGRELSDAEINELWQAWTPREVAERMSKVTAPSSPPCDADSPPDQVKQPQATAVLRKVGRKDSARICPEAVKAVVASLWCR
jgi:hypothetical protein